VVGQPLGFEPGFRRPAVVVSSDRFNRSRLSTVIVTAITSTSRLASAPGNVALPVGAGGLIKPSVVNISETMVIDRRRLIEAIGELPRSVVRAVDEGLRLALDL
jgi:mRNA interferase MazF